MLLLVTLVSKSASFAIWLMRAKFPHSCFVPATERFTGFGFPTWNERSRSFQMLEEHRKRASYQRGTVVRIKRKNRPDAWRLRYYDYDLFGQRVQKAVTFSDLDE